MNNSNQEKVVGSMEEESLKRKERLKNLKRKIAEDKKPKFRSYKPLDKVFDVHITPTEVDVNAVDDNIIDQLELIKVPIVIDEIDLSKLAPKKQDWDLKRDISKKLEKLEFRTQKVIAELIRERLKNNQDELYEAVNVGTFKNSSEF